jgi:hypothetical protein
MIVKPIIKDFLSRINFESVENNTKIEIMKGLSPNVLS